MKIDLNGEEVTIMETPAVKVTLSASDEFAGSGDSPTFTISNGKLDSASITNWLKDKYSLNAGSVGLTVNDAGKIIASSGISAGEVSVKVSETNGVDYKLTISCNVYKEDNKLVTNELSLEIGITVKPTDLLHGLPNGDLVKVTAGAILIVAIAILAALADGGTIAAGAGAAIGALLGA
ncbi:hypothetical protein [Lactobacillus sp. LL6]|uniref:hypothetical protein n=1 Tax=Lactobacillus sp. LL6 TaxID=2596827 RepID=UPI001186E0E2|nr:hypothetical protein [Lactobacillus sp. LL6]TSO26303.1 hypothetical protein FOD82_04330 [Lactobacillus sp. LL6]